MKALVTGAGGQDGHYLRELLLSKGYEVIGADRECTDIPALIRKTRPDEVYNLAAVVGDDWNVNAYLAMDCMEASADIGARCFQASTCQMYGAQTAYAKQKRAAHAYAQGMRNEAYVVGGILFNHESPRRGPEFVTQKIAQGVADILRGRQTTLVLGDLDACRDWGHAKDYVRAMWLTLQQPSPDDYQIATGEMRSVRELCDVAFEYVGLDYRDHVTSSPEFFRPDEPERLCGDPSKLKALGWKPEVTFDEMVKELIDAALER